MNDFSRIVLTRNERFLLFLLAFKKKMPGDVHSGGLYHLYLSDLIQVNYSDKRDRLNTPIPDGTFSLSDTGRRYKIYLRRERFHRYLTPITVSAITTIALNILEHWLLPEALNWLSGLF